MRPAMCESKIGETSVHAKAKNKRIVVEVDHDEREEDAGNVVDEDGLAVVMGHRGANAERVPEHLVVHYLPVLRVVR